MTEKKIRPSTLNRLETHNSILDLLKTKESPGLTSKQIGWELGIAYQLTTAHMKDLMRTNGYRLMVSKRGNIKYFRILK